MAIKQNFYSSGWFSVFHQAYFQPLSWWEKISHLDYWNVLLCVYFFSTPWTLELCLNLSQQYKCKVECKLQKSHSQFCCGLHFAKPVGVREEVPWVGSLGWVPGVCSEATPAWAVTQELWSCSTSGLPGHWSTEQALGTGVGQTVSRWGNLWLGSTPALGEKEQLMGNLFGRVTWLNQTALTVPCSLCFCTIHSTLFHMWILYVVPEFTHDLKQ